MRFAESKAITFLQKQKLSKKHCKDDIACDHCCQCWIKFKTAYETKNKILEEKNNALKKQNEFLSKLNKNLTKQLASLKHAAKLLDNMDDFKANIREQFKAELLKENEIEIMMKQELIAQLSQQNQNIRIQLTQFQSQKDKLVSELNIKNEKLKGLELYVQQLQENIKSLSEQLEQIHDKNEKDSKRIFQLERAIIQKTDIITKFQKSCAIIEEKYNLQKNRSSNLQFDKVVLEANKKEKENHIRQLSHNAQNNLQNIRKLSRNNEDLQNLVSGMDGQIKQNRLTEDYLKQRLIWTQQMADYNSSKVEMIKTDLHMLKTRI